MTYRIPRRVNLGRGYYIKVLLVTQTVIDEVYDDGDSLDGLWLNELGTGVGRAGTIYIFQGLAAAQRWEVYWHELVHALNDIMAWDRAHPILI